MSRTLWCDTQQQAFRTKADAVKAHPEAKYKRCDRCRFWHVDEKRRKRERGAGRRNNP